MMKINLREQLTKEDEKLSKNDPVIEAQKLLMSHEEDKNKVLRDLGMSREIDEKADVMSKALLRKEFREKFGPGIVTLDEIQKVCLDYHLRLLPSDLYAGKTDKLLAGEVLNFCKKNNLTPNRATFYVLAPPSLFRLTTTEGKTWMQAMRERAKDPDPVLFYRIDQEHYRIVHAWGNDFTLLRRLVAFPLRNEWTMAITAAMLMFTVLFCVASIFWYIKMPVALTFGAVSTICGFIYGFTGRYETLSKNELSYSKYNWRSTERGVFK